MARTGARISTTRLYGGAIALISGAYSIYLATTGPEMSNSAWFMLVLGVVVLLHGAALFTSLADRLGSASGPLMIVYAALMLLNQAWLATTGGPEMGSGMNPMDGMVPETAGMGWDPGMVLVALLMLASGAIMTLRDDMESDRPTKMD